ncbi:hypothetical protein LAX5112_04418 [Roseibium alexandrii]|uniref:Uncharacterized protein n=1 Tax=Roseibium alexandrii TaxID=388408 RepID=A0A0M7AQ75_9HYPH|nr:hypothetical protein LAX5112_04418 [Roseibium alexandrii]
MKGAFPFEIRCRFSPGCHACTRASTFGSEAATDYLQMTPSKTSRVGHLSVAELAGKLLSFM